MSENEVAQRRADPQIGDRFRKFMIVFQVAQNHFDLTDHQFELTVGLSHD